jgi:hypothetical protein
MELKDGQIKTKVQEQNKIIIFLEELRFNNSLNKKQVYHKMPLKNKLSKLLEKKLLQEGQEELQELERNSKLQMITILNH